MEFGDKDLSEKLQNNINNWLSEEYDSKGYLFSNEQFSFDFNEDNQFYSYLKNLERQKPYQGLPTLIEVIYRYIEHNGSNSLTDPKVLELATKQDWKKLIFIDIPKDERFNDFNKLRILRKILNQQISTELQPKINTLIFEVLEDEARTSSVLRCKNIEYVIRRLKE
ncbi:hypothetical protein CAP42_06400 [Acinetobacter indicus]|uniref:hypothetical protein n=1 Tax=Acinetobacter indicus TaxID=756892 RepID=UPI0005F83239|nr:hypothetical protein [Acinetobacter indicus]KJV44826.1 hypothetical protein VH96_05455 [Acinetobacter indicus]OUY10267.1 hypothetical protein CAP42_06400 [Acinetobacter indicus]